MPYAPGYYLYALTQFTTHDSEDHQPFFIAGFFLFVFGLRPNGPAIAAGE